MTVVGMKFSKGTMDNGQAYDSTKVYALSDMDGSKGNALGQAAVEFNLGTSEEFGKYKHLPFPFVATADMEIVTNGSSSKTVIRGLKPVERAK